MATIREVFFPKEMFEHHKALFGKARISSDFRGIHFGVATNFKVNLCLHQDEHDLDACGTVAGGQFTSGHMLVPQVKLALM
jgi:hypothetical protein